MRTDTAYCWRSHTCSSSSFFFVHGMRMRMRMSKHTVYIFFILLDLKNKLIDLLSWEKIGYVCHVERVELGYDLMI